MARVDHAEGLGVLAECTEYVQYLPSCLVCPPSTMYQVPSHYSFQAVNDHKGFISSGALASHEYYSGHGLVPLAHRFSI